MVSEYDWKLTGFGYLLAGRNWINQLLRQDLDRWLSGIGRFGIFEGLDGISEDWSGFRRIGCVRLTIQRCTADGASLNLFGFWTGCFDEWRERADELQAPGLMLQVNSAEET
jgi:hypothetical protein